MVVHECDACGFRGQWSDAWARWGTEDDDVLKVCSNACGEFALPSTRLIGKARGGYLESADVERARADLMRRRFERAKPSDTPKGGA